MTAEIRIDGVLLAAGSSSRFDAAGPKQLATFDAESMARRAAAVLVASQLRRVTVVTGCREAEVRRALDGLDVAFVHNAQWREGQSGSVRVGLGSEDGSADALCFAPCDQPLLDVATVDRLLQAFHPEQRPIVVPVHRGRRGAPVVFARRFFAELAAIEGDEGGRQVVSRYGDLVEEVELASERALLDVDTLEDLERVRGLL